jgi:hypothetical protein
VEEKNKLAEENSSIERRYKYISEVAKREFGISPPNKRKYRHHSPNSENCKDSKNAQNNFDWCMESPKNRGDDEEVFSAIIKKDPMKQEINLEWRAPEVLESKGIRGLIKRLNLPRPKTASIKNKVDIAPSAMHPIEPQIKEELSDSRIHLATPNSSPECDLANMTEKAFEIPHPVDDRVACMDKEVKREDSEINLSEKVYSPSDLGTEEAALGI